MVLYVMKWDIRPDKVEEYNEWAKEAIPQLLSVPGLLEYRGFRPATGASQAVTTYEFEGLSDWASWYASEVMQKLIGELRIYTENVTSELWGPSPIVTKPLHPEK
jgi:antibiotic biosynthesis monooxygenase (ABM) superfamily enzyme